MNLNLSKNLYESYNLFMILFHVHMYVCIYIYIYLHKIFFWNFKMTFVLSNIFFENLQKIYCIVIGKIFL
jgi:hypothetical protein